jgi:acyl-CoA synthetase (AMP-forming)/AMP-acid ligase II
LGDPRTADTFPKMIRAAAAAYGDQVAFRLKGDTLPDDEITYAQLEARTAELAKGLLARGVGKGSRVGFIAGNGPTFAVYFGAITRIGAIAIALSTLIKSNELVRFVRQSDLAGLIVQRKLLNNDYVERLCDALPALREGDSAELRLPRTPFLRWIVSTGENLPPTFRDISWLTGAAGSVSDELLLEVESEVHPTDQMVEIYTSGSMALPKGVKHNHGTTLYRSELLARMGKWERHKDQNIPLPMFWVGGMVMYLTCGWQFGSTVNCTEGTSTNSRMAFGSVLQEEDLKFMPTQDFYWGLGMTETLGPYSYGDEMRRPGFPLCPPLDHWVERYDVRVADENDQQVAVGEIGEIQVRGYAVTPGLHKVERAAYFTADGYYRTGDMGLQEETRVNFIGRNGDMIKSAGSNVSPAEVEMEMMGLEGVHSAYVVGLPDRDRGNLVVAAVVPRDGAKLDFGEIEAQLRKRISSYKVPRAYAEFRRDEVPMLPSNKVARRQIEKMMSERLGRT